MNEHTNCHVEPVEKPLDEAALANASTAYLKVQGMGCPRCAMRVRNGLLGLDGVLTAEIFLGEGLAAAAYDPARVTSSDLIAAVVSAGNDGRHYYQAQIISQAPAATAPTS
jgi:copper chaperone CopZ